MESLLGVTRVAKRTAVVLAVVLVASLSVFAQAPTWPRFEFNLAGGYGLSQFKGTSTYADDWSYRYLQYVNEKTTLSLKGENAFFFKGSFSYYFTPKIGLQLGGGLFSSNVPVTSEFSFKYKWTSGSTVYEKSKSWDGEGKLSTIPLFLNVVGKFQLSFMDIVLSAGPAMYFNSYEGNSFVGFGDTWYGVVYIWPYYYYVQYVDAFKIPVEIPKTSWTAFGGNVGIGFDFKVSPTIAIAVEGRYFLVPEKKLRWEWVPGTYDSVLYEHFQNWKYDAEDFQDYQEKTTGISIKPSFFSFAVGLKIYFGQK